MSKENENKEFATQQEYVATLHDDQFWDNDIAPKINEINNQFGHFFTEKEFEEEETLIKELEDAKERYKKDVNHALYWFLIIIGFVLSFIALIFPLYFAIKKFKEIKHQKELLLEEIEEAHNNYCQFKYNAIQNLDITDYYDQHQKLTKFENRGPINESLLDFISQRCRLNLENNAERNTYNSHWGFFNDKTLVIAAAAQSLRMGTKIYTGSASVSYRSGDDYQTDIVYAQIEKPYPYFDKKTRHLLFSPTCDRLTLSLVDVYPKANRKIPRDEPELENEIFSKSFEWNKNDEVQFRMVFTPYAQEIYLENAFDSEKNFKNNYNLTKTSAFFTNNLSLSTTFRLFPALNQYINDDEGHLAHVERKIRQYTEEWVYKYFRLLTPGYWMPLLSSENHKVEIEHQVQRSKMPTKATFHYLLNTYIKEPVIKAMTETFHYIEDTAIFNTNYGDKVFSIKMTGCSFQVYQRVEYVSAYSWRAGKFANVAIYYDEYIPVYGSKYMYLLPIKNKWNLLNISWCVKKNSNEKMHQEISEVFKEYPTSKFYIDKDFFLVYSEENNWNAVSEIFDKVVPIINKYNA